MRSTTASRPLRLAAAILLLCAAPRASRAAQYEADIRIETETDLEELRDDGQISEETFETLLDLYRNGVALGTATREEIYALPGMTYEEADAILEYRDAAGAVTDPVSMVAANVISEERLLEIAPFLLRETNEMRPYAGTARFLSTWSPTDRNAPATAVQARVRGFGFTIGGVALLNRLDLGSPAWDSRQRVLVASAPHAAVYAPKFFAQWQDKNTKVILGTFRAGFGQKLVLDNSGRPTPDGLYLDDTVAVPPDFVRACDFSTSFCGDDANRYLTDDLRIRTEFRGLAVSSKLLSVGSATIRGTAFGSYQSRDLYQYELYDRRACPDPRDDADPACAAPPLAVPDASGTATPTRYAFTTIPNVFHEALAGGNVTASFFGRGRIGLTGYAATTTFSIPGADLDFQEYSRFPRNGGFGAIGMDGAWGTGRWNFFLEGARSFDHVPDGGGGYGVIQRTTYGDKKSEVELALRYYDSKYANPYARPISGPDELNGLRAINEAGARVRWLGAFGKELRLRAVADVWTWPSDGGAAGTAGRTNLDTYVRADWFPNRTFALAGWAGFRDKDLGPDDAEAAATGSAVSACYDVPTETNTLGESIPCTGKRMRAGVRASYDLTKRLGISVQYQHALQDDPKKTSYRQDLNAYVELEWKATDKLKVRWRTRYLDEDISDNTILQTTLWSWVDAVWMPHPGLSARFRYDAVKDLDQRASTLAKSPSLQNRFRVDIEGSF